MYFENSKRLINAFISVVLVLLVFMGLFFLSRSPVMDFSITAAIEDIVDDFSNDGSEDVNVPMLDTDALSLYESGQISRETAMLRIETRLNILLNRNEIIGWSFDDSAQAYNVFMNNGAVFRYSFNG